MLRTGGVLCSLQLQRLEIGRYSGKGAHMRPQEARRQPERDPERIPPGVFPEYPWGYSRIPPGVFPEYPQGYSRIPPGVFPDTPRGAGLPARPYCTRASAPPVAGHPKSPLVYRSFLCVGKVPDRPLVLLSDFAPSPHAPNGPKTLQNDLF